MRYLTWTGRKSDSPRGGTVCRDAISFLLRLGKRPLASAALLLLGVGLYPRTVAAQGVDSSLPFLKISGFANATVGSVPQESQVPQHSRIAFLPQVGVQLTPQIKDEGVVYAARLTFDAFANVAESHPSWTASVSEASAFVISRFGRFEIGERAGFPQTLLGYAPAEIAFTPADFGPESGVRLTPNGRLPTMFLRGDLADRIDALTYLGYAARFYENPSPKLIYVSPRFHGFYWASSFTPRTERPAGLAIGRSSRRDADRRMPLASPGSLGKLNNLTQAAFVYERRSPWLDLVVGTTFSRATAAEKPAPGTKRFEPYSIAAGVTAIVEDTWTVGAAATYDGFSRNRGGGRPGFGAAPFGAVGSLEYVDGPWVVGGYYQYAAAVTGDAAPQQDRVHVGELGVSYLVDSGHDDLGAGYYTDLKLYGGVYVYDFVSHAAGGGRDHEANGLVLFAGLRFSFF